MDGREDIPHRFMQINQAARLLLRDIFGLDAGFGPLATGSVGAEWPFPETELEDHLFSAATLVSWNQHVLNGRGKNCDALLAAGALSI